MPFIRRAAGLALTSELSTGRRTASGTAARAACAEKCHVLPRPAISIAPNSASCLWRGTGRAGSVPAPGVEWGRAGCRVGTGRV